MNDIKQIAKIIGHAKLADALGLSDNSISMAIKRGFFPPAWEPTVVKLGTEEGVVVPRSVFKWRVPEDAEDRAS